MGSALGRHTKTVYHLITHARFIVIIRSSAAIVSVVLIIGHALKLVKLYLLAQCSEVVDHFPAKLLPLAGRGPAPAIPTTLPVVRRRFAIVSSTSPRSIAHVPGVVVHGETRTTGLCSRFTGLLVGVIDSLGMLLAL